LPYTFLLLTSIVGTKSSLLYNIGYKAWSLELEDLELWDLELGLKILGGSWRTSTSLIVC
jgi:hypothetical protein